MARLILSSSEKPGVLNIYDFCNSQELGVIIKGINKNISGDLFLSANSSLVFTDVEPESIYNYYCNTIGSENGTPFQDTEIFQSKTLRQRDLEKRASGNHKDFVLVPSFRS